MDIRPIIFLLPIGIFRGDLLGVSTLNMFSFVVLTLFSSCLVNTSVNVLYLLEVCYVT